MALHFTARVQVRGVYSKSATAVFLDRTHLLAQDNPTINSSQFLDYEEGDMLELEIEVLESGRRMIRGIQQVHMDDVERPLEKEPEKEEIEAPSWSTALSSEGGWTNGVYFPGEIARLFNAADRLARGGETINVLLTGPSGYGKTTYARKFAQVTGRAFLRVNCASVRDPEEWFGYREARDGSTVFEPSSLTELVESGNAVILLDEFNRVEPWIHDTLFPLLDDARETEIHGRTIKCGPNLVFMATLNRGSAFTGTFTLDQALCNRMDASVVVRPLDHSVEVEVVMRRTGVEEQAANEIVSTLSYFRRDEDLSRAADFSTRTSIKVARLMEGGLSVREAFEYGLFVENDRAYADVTDYLNAKLGEL